MSGYVPVQPKLRYTALTTCLGLAFELASPLATAGTVTSCDDGPNAAQIPGTLRYEIAHAPEGGTVDIALLGPFCTDPNLPGSVITLETGGITITQNDLAIVGPPGGVIIANDKYGIHNGLQPVNDRVFNHQGTGTLTLSGLSLLYGKYLGSPTRHNFGGCLYSKGSLQLSNVTIAGCQVQGEAGYDSDAYAYGGGVFAQGSVTMVSSTIRDNRAVALPPFLPGIYHNSFAKCGGVEAKGYLTLEYSTIQGNYVRSPIGFSGGVCAEGGAKIDHSTISGNTVTATTAFIKDVLGGGIVVSAGTLRVVDSTISGNVSQRAGGGIVSEVPTYISGSTIAFNYSGSTDTLEFGPFAAGLALVGATRTDTIKDSIIAYNRVGSVEDDLSAENDSYQITLAGSNNLVLASQQGNLTLPLGWITGACPLLGPLRDNGGPTLTHALLSGSPAIDAGITTNASTDQRQLPRESPPGFPDIGAYEVQQNDIVFNASFEGCP